MINAIYRPKEAAKYLGMGLTIFWQKQNPKSPYFDETFPRPFKLHGEQGKAVGFLRSELDKWATDTANANRVKGVAP